MAKTIVPTLTVERLRELLIYEPDTGLFRWRFSRRGAKAGAVCGSPHPRNHYIRICVDREPLSAHRLAWMYVHGAWPATEIDHRNGIRTDNRIENLRMVTSQTNRENLHGPRKDNKSGRLLGVSIQRSNGDTRYRARIWINGKEVGLGRFDTPEAAHAAYLEAKRLHHAGCTI